jgi:hypothetical protein
MSERRGFMCPMTERLCESPRCTRIQCVAEGDTRKANATLDGPEAAKAKGEQKAREVNTIMHREETATPPLPSLRHEGSPTQRSAAGSCRSITIEVLIRKGSSAQKCPEPTFARTRWDGI